MLELLDYSNIKKAIFIFDDLERCGLSIIQTLGILNDLIENNGVKIIIIANQKEIGKVSDSSNLPHKYMVALKCRNRCTPALRLPSSMIKKFQKKFYPKEFRLFLVKTHYI